MKRILYFFGGILISSCIIHGADPNPLVSQFIAAVDRHESVDKLEKRIINFKQARRDVNQLWSILGNVENVEPDIIQLLVKHGANVNSRVRASIFGQIEMLTPLQLAAENDNAKAMKKLLELGADSSIKDNSGLTALWYASQRGNISAMRLLLSSGVNEEDVLRAIRATKNALKNPHFANAMGIDFKAILKILEDHLAQLKLQQRRDIEKNTAIVTDLPENIMGIIGQYVGPLAQKEREQEIIAYSMYAGEYRQLNKILEPFDTAKKGLKKLIAEYPREPLDVTVKDPFGRRSEKTKEVLQVDIDELEDMMTKKILDHPWKAVKVKSYTLGKKESLEPLKVSVKDLEEERDELWQKMEREYWAAETKRASAKD